MHKLLRSTWALVLAVVLCGTAALAAFVNHAAAQSPPPPDPAIKSFAVKLPDNKLSYPSTSLPDLSDEHTTIIPTPDGSYLFFSASSLPDKIAGAVVLETRDLVNFSFASDRGYADRVMAAPIPFGSCDPTRVGEFDLNYAAPGSVVQDPTRAPGNMMMFYEAENHCPDGTDWQRPFYATVGYARSFDFGKTWPAPINSEFGGKNRHPVLKLATPEPTTFEPSPVYMGNAIPSAFVDCREHGACFVYLTYVAPQQGADGLLRVARARLGGNDDQSGGDNGNRGDGQHRDEGHHRLHFEKWYNGGFSQPGIGGLDTGVLTARGCPGVQENPVISFNDDLGLYMLTYVCVDTVQVPGRTFQGGWYYSTATSLEKQDWTQPRLILNSSAPVIEGCNKKDDSGREFDGWYPSFMSPGAAPGHLKLTGKVFFMGGCDTAGGRTFASRDFEIAKGP
jgi:hypothetical protein